jgi:hypothetical protein
MHVYKERIAAAVGIGRSHYNDSEVQHCDKDCTLVLSRAIHGIHVY